MVSLEKNDHLMLARQLPLKSVALILAGGRGTRLKDLTNKRAKPAVHFGGKFRIIDFALSNCINSGIRRMGVITQYQSHTLVQHIQRGWSFFNEEMNEFVDLLPAQQRMKGEARITIPTYLPIPTTYCVLRCWGGLGQKWPAGLTHSGVLMWCMRTTGMQALRLRIWRRAGVRRSRCLLCTTWPIKACFMHIT